MSAAQTITVDNTAYTIARDCRTVYNVVIYGAVADETGGSFNAPGFTATPARSDLAGKTTRQGLFAITGWAELAFPNLATTPYSVDLTLRAPGYRDYPLTVDLPVNTTLPVIASAVTMRRQPVRLQGRVVDEMTGQPVAGVFVASVDNPNPPSPPPPPPVSYGLLLRSPLAQAHKAGAQVQPATLTATGAAHLTAAAQGGASTVSLDSTAGLGSGVLIHIATPDATVAEYAQYAGPGTLPGQIALRDPLCHSYGVNASVQFATGAPAGAAASLLSGSDPGDGILVADQLYTSGTFVIDFGTPAAVEYFDLGALTDSNGYYGFQGTGHVRELYLNTTPADPKKTVSWAIAFDQPVNIVDLRI
jgi:hypothetical protein